MAEAKVDIQRRVTVVETVTLTLSRDEADTVAVVLANVAGSDNSPRKHAGAVFSALRAAGITTLGLPERRRLSGMIRFADYPDSDG